MEREFEPSLPRHVGFSPMILALIVTAGVITGPRSSLAQTQPSGSWKNLPDMPAPRWEAGTVVLDNKLYVFGGYTRGTKSSKRADVFDPADTRWKQLADLPSAITHVNAVLDGRSVWLAGGFKDGYKGHAIAEVWKYDVDRNAYVEGPSLPEPRAGGGLALVGRRLHYVGGLKPDRLTDAADHWVLDLNAVAEGSGAWKRGADLPRPHSHAEGSTFVHNGRVFMMGGMTREGKRRRIDEAIWALWPGGEWKVLGKLPRPLSSRAAAIIGERLFVAGGSLNGADPQPGMWVSGAQESSDADTHWPGWLGPNRNGWVSGFQPPARWPERLQKIWNVEVGTGYGSPLVSGGRVYQHARQGDDEVVWCLDLETGAVRWRRSYAAPFTMGKGSERHGKGPKSCPVLADGRLFTLSISGILTAWDAASGKLLWRHDDGKRFKKSHPYWGAATSPLVVGKRVVVHLGTDGQGALIALDAKSGKEVWSQGRDGPAYSSPLLVEIQGIRQIVEWNERSLVGVDSGSGRLLWEHPFPQVRTDQNMPTPTFHRGLVLLGGENRGLHGIEPKLEGGAWKVKERWRQEKVALDMSSAVVNGNLLYGLSHYGRGRFFCLDPGTGDVRWQGPGRTGENVTFLAMPGHVAALVNDGELKIIAANGDRFEQIASYRVAESPTWAPPVLLKSGLLVKDRQTLTRWSFIDALK